MGKFKAGDTISHLLLKEFRSEDAKGRRKWMCECICGKIVFRRTEQLVEDRVLSCGCKHPLKGVKGQDHHYWKGCGNLSGQFFTMIRHSAKNRSIDFNISIEYAWELFVQQGGRCALTGLDLNFCGDRDRKKGMDQSASLDRIDSTGPYERGNLQWIHKDVNKMKNDYSTARFKEICRLVTENDALIPAHPIP